MEGAACTNIALRWRRPGYIRPGVFMPPMTAFMRALAAVNEALRKVDTASSGGMAKLTGMKGLPF